LGKGYPPWKLFSIDETPKRHFLGAIRVVWDIVRANRFSGPVCRLGNETKKGITCSALALSTVLRTTSLSYGNMPFSGTHPTKTPWPIILKFCTVDYVGETTKHAKNDYNRLARGGSPYRWNISIYTLLYPFLPFRYQAYRPRPLNRFARTISQTTRIAPRKCLLGSHRWKKFFTGEYPFPKIFKGHFTCKSKKSNNFGQVKDNRKIPKPTYTKSGSRNRTVTSLPVWHAPKRPKSSFCHFRQ
jgi:hypothetical protein